jgi:hypothetical protein
LIGQHGQSGVQSAMNNSMMGGLTSQLSQTIQCHPGIPQFARDEMCQALNDVQQGCPCEPTPPRCQEDTDNAMSEIIDKVIDKLVDQIMDKLAGGGCEGGSFKDMVRQAIEDVVREKIGGGAEDGGCAADGGATSTDGAKTDGDDIIGKVIDQNAEATRKDCDDDRKKDKNEGKSWLAILAGTFAEMQAEHLNKAMEAQNTMQNSTGEDQKKEFMQANADFQQEMQMFKMVSESSANALKSIGEALNSMARKQ